MGAKRMEKGKKNAIDWLKVIACIGILIMHVKENTSYAIPGLLYNNVVPLFADFVFLFMAISSFGLCYSYYQ